MLTPQQGFTYNKFEKPNDWPKIKETFDYQYDESGHLIGGNEHLYLSGPVTYTTVGNPTIKDNMLVGPSPSNYIKGTSIFPDMNGINFEIVVALYNAGDGSGQGFANILVLNGLVIALTNTGSPELQVSTKKSGESDYTLRTVYNWNISTLPGYFFVKVTKLGNIIKIQASRDGIMYNAGNSYTLEDGEEIRVPETEFYFMNASRWKNIGTSLDLSKTYIKIGGNLWFYGKNYTTEYMTPVPAGLEYNNTTTPEIGFVYTNNELIKGPITYNKVGEPKIVNGIVSGFSNDNYLSISAFPFRVDFICQVKIKPNSFNRCTLFGGRNAYYIGWWLTESKTVKFGFRLSDGNGNSTVTMFTSNELTANNTYICKASRSGQVVNFIIYENGTTFQTGSYTIASGYNYTTASQGVFGIGKSLTSNEFFDGYIDLNETYMTNNGQAWFGSISKFQEFISVPQGTMLSKDDTHTLNVVSKNNIGTVGYTVVGNPTISDNNISGFSADNYITTQGTLPSTVNNFEFITKFKTGSDLSGTQQIFHNYKFTSLANNCEIIILNGNLCAAVYIDGAYIASSSSGSKSLNANTSYTAKLAFDGSKYTFSWINGNSWEQIWQVNNTTNCLISDTKWGINRTNTRPFAGVLDFNNTYIKINDQVWFGTLPAEPKLVGPVSYIVEGSPTIVNGVVSGFSDDNYLQTDLVFPNSKVSNGYTLQVKFTMPNSESEHAQQLITAFVHGTADGLSVTSSRKMSFFYGGSGHSIGSNPNAVALGGTYIARAVVTATNVYIYLGTSEDNLQVVASGERVAYEVGNQYKVRIGAGQTSSRVFGGSIDLNNTYISINGNLWFGKENWNPSSYTDNSIYLLSGHKSDYSQYNELGINPIIETDSDELGTYNVWIDNQKIIENKLLPTTIHWNELALTTGYNITTPSSLKAHILKVCPTNNGQIIKYTSDSNYIIENGQLISADPNLYIQFTGTQYIDTGFKANQDTRIEITFSSTTNNLQGVFSSRTAYNNAEFGIYIIDTYIRDTYNSTYTELLELIPDTYYTIDKDKNETYVDGVLKATNTVTTFQSNKDLVIGCQTGGSLVNYFTGNIKATKVYDNGTLIRHLVPVPAGLDIGDYTVPSNGMFDIVNQVFYPNSGTGTLGIGKDN